MDTLFVALRVILSLAAVLGLLWYAQRRLTRGKSRSKAAELVTVVGRQGIGLKASVVVVDVDGKRFLLGVTEHAVNVLHSDDVPALETATTAEVTSESPAKSFANTLAEVTDISGAATAPTAPLRPRKHQPSVQASGSILSPSTWKQTAAALRQIR
ncbi:flagellar protein FliO/FliZ [Okibacterium sp. HSC-33S16]|uniref:FliO/MopB family protein n=1 Tax=Okibacterium sp. HSC-33S16 TaxID=2910965 RepID=UPI0020A1FD6B|nr:flagellar biosynthetic protein FliO [Okibacterium sp. HSC-33S16]MCP2032939.1 flagellar protein FliO/FliZ [Okibacterium sp. HSC-33S16]